MNKKSYFSIKEYKKLIKFFKNLGYNFVFFSKNIKKNKNIILRHDVDIDISKAYEMAKIENKLNIKSTYFFLTSSKLYNCLENKNQNLIKKISELGHEIGLHFDFSIYQNSYLVNLDKMFNLEKKILEDIIGKKIKCVSFHKPGKNGIPKKLNYCRLLNVYNHNFFKKILYYSDSKGIWRFGEPILDEKVLKFKRSLQLLIHPIWWISNKRLDEKGNARLLKKFMKDLYQKKYNYLQSYKKF